VAGRDEIQLLGAIAGRFDQLIRECEASLQALEQSLPVLRDARRRLGEPQETQPIEESPGQPVHDVARIQVRHASIEDLLDFQEQLARLPGVAGVSISAMGEGGAALVVEMRGGEPIPRERDGDDAAPTVVCTVCGRTIAQGSDQVSHGLCSDCTSSFLRGEIAR
jgi:hypothetical protein